ncbi:hypothetical protein CAOG_03588 [Capsaspora owczarzaki ATCC 30864]|uniref:hypothetical protein n=1 Tax=Capsaspora owczarzaki (strain ATCC 30864) TaxID=595528 RepID=UPI00035245A6|nr:hypothetical protein CAOG_03588 [Capsaspora owczarzaki ATCC 30864]|eukprot:XP_004363316.2 hypothetical protein CAOG_03588 [Capsaspora owczarzaki ATCC 30864]
MRSSSSALTSMLRMTTTTTTMMLMKMIVLMLCVGLATCASRARAEQFGAAEHSEQQHFAAAPRFAEAPAEGAPAAANSVLLLRELRLKGNPSPLERRMDGGRLSDQEDSDRQMRKRSTTQQPAQPERDPDADAAADAAAADVGAQTGKAWMALASGNGTAPEDERTIADLPDWAVVLCIGVSAFLSGVAMGLTSFGSAIVFHLCWQLFLLFSGIAHDDLSQLVGLLAIMDWGTVPPLLYICWKDVDATILGYLVVPMAVTTALGSYILVTTPPDILKLILGIIFIVFATWRILLEVFQSPRGMAWLSRMHLETSTLQRSLARCLLVLFPPPSLLTVAAPADEFGQHEMAVVVPLDGTAAVGEPPVTTKQPQLDAQDDQAHLVCATQDEIDEKVDSIQSLQPYESDEQLDVEPGVQTDLDEPSEPPAARRANNTRCGCYPYWPRTNLSTGRKIFTAIAGVTSGFLRGLFGVGGPPLMVYVSLSGLDKKPLRATVTATSMVTLPILTGYLLIYEGRLKSDEWPRYLTAVCCSCVGLLIGNLLFKKFNTATVLRFILVLLVVAAMTMMSLPMIPTIVLLGLLATGLVTLWLHNKWRQRQRERAEAEISFELLRD